MSFISYAQNFEDVMLWRALKGIEGGFYIDIGANHPIAESVTKSFSEHGWKGINVEPEKELCDLLAVDRPKDLNLNIAISASVQSIDFFVSSIRGWSTTDKESLSNLKDKESFSETRIIPAISLDKLCEQYNVGEVHFLKVDVEGAEKDVLLSFSFKEVRPWIVVVEATKPTTQIDVSSKWESILFEHSYQFAYFDGLNKFYVANEHSELADILKIPPNVFDDYQLAGHRDLALNLKEAELKVNKAEIKVSEAETEVNRLNQELLNGIKANTELLGRLTTSLNLLEKRSLIIENNVLPFQTKIVTSAKKITLKILQHAFLWLKARPTYLSIAIKIINKNKYIQRKVNTLLPTIRNKQNIQSSIVLSERAEKVLTDLKRLNK